MQYLISDIHGDLNGFKKLLEHLDFNNDKLIILGDVLDKGSKPMESFDMVRTLMRQYPGHVLGCIHYSRNTDLWEEFRKLIVPCR